MADASSLSGMSKGGEMPSKEERTSIKVPRNVLEALEDKHGVFVKQRVDLLEVACDWEVPNKYDVFSWTPPTAATPTMEDIHAGIDGDFPMMRVEEDPAGCCMRQCCKNARAWKMHTRLLLPSGVRETEDMRIPLHFSRPFKCTFFCLARPVAFVWWGEHVIAQVTSPWDCCDWCFVVGPPSAYEDRAAVHPDMVSAPDAPWYTLKKHMCSKDLCCDCCYASVDIPVCDAASGEQVGDVSKVWKGWAAECFSKANNYCLRFPDGALPIQKAALLGCTLLVDFTIFEMDKNNNNSG